MIYYYIKSNQTIYQYIFKVNKSLLKLQLFFKLQPFFATSRPMSIKDLQSVIPESYSASGAFPPWYQNIQRGDSC